MSRTFRGASAPASSKHSSQRARLRARSRISGAESALAILSPDDASGSRARWSPGVEWSANAAQCATSTSCRRPSHPGALGPRVSWRGWRDRRTLSMSGPGPTIGGIFAPPSERGHPLPVVELLRRDGRAAHRTRRSGVQLLGISSAGHFPSGPLRDNGPWWRAPRRDSAPRLQPSSPHGAWTWCWSNRAADLLNIGWRCSRALRPDPTDSGSGPGPVAQDGMGAP